MEQTTFAECLNATLETDSPASAVPSMAGGTPGLCVNEMDRLGSLPAAGPAPGLLLGSSRGTPGRPRIFPAVVSPFLEVETKEYPSSISVRTAHNRPQSQGLGDFFINK